MTAARRHRSEGRLAQIAPFSELLVVAEFSNKGGSSIRSKPQRFSRMIDWSSCPAVERDPERVSGAWVFRGTRVPVAALFENLEDGALVSEFIEWFPGVTMEQARAVLEHAARSALAPA